MRMIMHLMHSSLIFMILVRPIIIFIIRLLILFNFSSMRIIMPIGPIMVIMPIVQIPQFAALLQYVQCLGIGMVIGTMHSNMAAIFGVAFVALAPEFKFFSSAHSESTLT